MVDDSNNLLLKNNPNDNIDLKKEINTFKEKTNKKLIRGKSHTNV